MARRPQRKKRPARPRAASAPRKLHALQQELQRNLREREAILNNSLVGIAFVAADNRIKWNNRMLEQLYGYVPGELVGEHAEFAYPSRDAYYELGRAAAPVIKSGGIFEKEVEMQRKDGARFAAFVSGKAIDAADLSQGAVWVVRDITPRKKLEAELNRSLLEREALLDSTLVGITFAAERRLLWVNDTFARMLGYQRDELIGQTSRIHFPDQAGYEAFGAAAYPVLAAGRPFETEQQMRRKDGTLIWCQVYGHAVDPSDLSRGSIWTNIDITERKRLQDEIKRSLAEREAILQSTLVGITFSVNRRHLWLNQTLARMLGYSVDELIGQLSLIHFPDQRSFDALGAAAYPALASGRPYATEQQMKRKDGSLVWCQIYGNAIDPADLAKGTIWTFVDITELKRAEEDIRRALAKERELNELKSRFVAMTSHEFRTPLATILSSAELIEHYGERLPPEEKQEIFDSIRAGVERMAKMLDDVLMIGRTEAQMIQFNPAPLNLADFCERLADETRRSIAGGHTIDFEFDGGRIEVNMDEKLLRHVLGNLLSNALKYSHPGGAVEFHARLADGAAEFVVADHGIGIPREDQARLFESFHRARNVGNIAGTGLGLAIVKKSVDLQRGAIAFESEPGEGTRFTVSIPVN